MLRNSNQNTRPRVAPVAPPYDADTAAALEALGPPLGIFRVFARRPVRAHGLAGWGRYYLSRRCALSLRHRELLILRVTARCGAEYEWGVHVQVFAAKAGLTGEQVRSVTAGHPDDPCWTEPADRAVLRAAGRRRGKPIGPALTQGPDSRPWPSLPSSRASARQARSKVARCRLSLLPWARAPGSATPVIRISASGKRPA